MAAAPLGQEALSARGLAASPCRHGRPRIVTRIATSSRPPSSGRRAAQEDLAALQQLELKAQKISQRQSRPVELSGGLAAIQRQLMQDGVISAEEPAACSDLQQPLPSLPEISAAIEATKAEATRLEALCAARDAAIAGRDVQQEQEEEWQREQARQRLLVQGSAASSSSPVQLAGPASSPSELAAVRSAEAVQHVSQHLEPETPAAEASVSPQQASVLLPAGVGVQVETEASIGVEDEAAEVAPSSMEAADTPQEPFPVQQPVKMNVAVQCWTRPGEDLVLAGSAPVLGSWQLAQALPLQWTTGGWWRAEFEVPADAVRVEYKAVLLVGSRIVWEAGPNKSQELLDAVEVSVSHVFAA